MAPNFQSSFIPKEPVTEEVFKKKKAGVFGILAVSLFIFSIIVSVAMYVYKGIVKDDIKNLQSELTIAEGAIDKKAISEMSEFSKKLKIVKSIIQKHQAASNFLDLLASSTVSSVQFTGFNYSSVKEGELSVTLEGRAGSYAAIALQENVLSKNEYLKSVIFSDLNLVEGGLVAFELTMSVDPQISIYSP